MKFYFCGSITGGRQLAHTYQKIIEMIGEFGQVLTEHLGNDNEIETRDRVLSAKQIHDRDMDWVRQSDLVIADVTLPSLGVGYEIGRAIEFGLPVLCLFKSDTEFRLSAMIEGSEGVEMFEYTDPASCRLPIERFISENAPC